MKLRTILTDLAIAVGVFVVGYLVLATDVVSALVGPIVTTLWEPVAPLFGLLPLPIQIGIGLLGSFLVLVNLWLVTTIGTTILKILTGADEDSGSSAAMPVLVGGVGILLVGVLVVGALLAAGPAALPGDDSGTTDGTNGSSGVDETNGGDEPTSGDGGIDSLWGDDGVTGLTDDAFGGDGPTSGDGGDDSVWGDDGVTDLTDDAFGEDGSGLSGNDLTGGGHDCEKPPGTDSDGDRLPDQWERNGETPGGAPLPDADPERKDLYVQLVYDTDADRIPETKKDRIRKAFDEMPVSNPSGEDGIALHFVDQAPNDGRVDEQITSGESVGPAANQYYDEEMLGDGVCDYHLLAVGTVRDAGGRGGAPGYVAIANSEIVGYGQQRGSYSPIVHVVVHELLHNIVGKVGVGYHTDTGWLSSGDYSEDGEHLSDATKEQLEDGFEPS